MQCNSNGDTSVTGALEVEMLKIVFIYLFHKHRKENYFSVIRRYFISVSMHVVGKHSAKHINDTFKKLQVKNNCVHYY